MCGIFGTITEKGLDAREIERIKGSLRHRGPDDKGSVRFDAAPGGVLDLVHLRLSIIDLSEEASQPMSYDNGTLWIVYNGEVFNYVELKKELGAKGYKFSTKSDTEVVLASYKEWGEACVERFNGDWAFCIYDRTRNILFFSRDRLGVKPLYYYHDGKNLAFSSEIKALFALPFVKCEWDHDKIGTFALLGVSDFSGSTMYKGIYQVEPASNMRFDLGTKRLSAPQKHWIPALGEDGGKFDPRKEKEYIRDIRDLLEDAVRIRLRSDVPVGTCLSGGIDSSMVTVLINNLIKKGDPDARSVGEKQKTFTAVYPGEDIDEEKWAEDIIDLTGADGKFVRPGPKDLENDLDDFISVHDELCRSTSMYAQYKVLQLASRHVKVVLDGQGADELFGGYLHYKKHVQKFGLSITPRWLLSLAYLSKKSVLEGVLKNRIDISSAADILKQKYPLGLARALYIDETKYNLQQLLRYEDRNSMHFGIEARVPFTDHRLVEYALGIPACYKIRNGWSKYILRKAAEGLLPEKIVWRRDKIGFETPEKEWLMNMDEFRYFLNKFGVNSYNGERFWWRMFNFQKLNVMI